MKRINLILVAALMILGSAIYAYSVPSIGSGTIMYGQNNPAASPTLAPGGSYPLRVDPFGNLILSNNGGGGSVSPGTNAFFADPGFVYPNGTGNIWFVDGDHGSDSNTCKSTGSACLTITHAISLAGSGTNDAIIVMPTSTTIYTESVVINKDYLTLFCAVSTAPQDRGENAASGACEIEPVTGVPLTITNRQATVIGFFIDPADGTSKDVYIVGTGSNGASGFRLLHDFIVPYSNTNTNPNVYIDQGAHGASGGIISNSQLDDSVLGIDVHNSVAGLQVVNNTFTNQQGPLVKGNNANSLLEATISDNIVGPTNLGAQFILASAATTSNPIVTGNSFAVSYLTLTQLTMPAGVFPGDNNPSGVNGSPVPSTTNTLISSHITTAAAQNIFTASGDIDVTDIALTTNATGLAGGTNFVLSTDNTFGALSLCSQAVSGLGANVSVKCSAASVTTLKPFRLLSGKHILATCSVGNCTGAGTITVTPIASRAAPYASFTNVALP